MSQRIAIASVVVILAAFGLLQSRLPLTSSLVGTYLAEGRQSPTRHVLTLNGDLSATLRTDGGNSGEPDERGSWIMNGSSVQVSLIINGGEPTMLMLTPKDRSLVVTGTGRRNALAGLVFEREADSPANEPAEH